MLNYPAAAQLFPSDRYAFVSAAFAFEGLGADAMGAGGRRV